MSYPQRRIFTSSNLQKLSKILYDKFNKFSTEELEEKLEDLLQRKNNIEKFDTQNTSSNRLKCIKNELEAIAKIIKERKEK